MRNSNTFLRVYADVEAGHTVHPRGLECREVTDYQFCLNMADSFLTNFKARDFSLKYACEEWKWYLRGDKYDQSIEQYASMWQKIRQPDGSYFSNYGQYIFPGQFRFVLNELLRDPSSRRASIVILKPEHLFADNTDVVCTYAINFRIRFNRLDMSVMMRSNDVIFGMTNDVFCFSMLYRLLFACIKGHYQLRPGYYTHFVNSLHVYQKHYEMIRRIVSSGISGYVHDEIPWPTKEEAMDTINHGFLANRGEWSKWLIPSK